MYLAGRDDFIRYVGKPLRGRNATTHVLNHSLHYGLTVFEGLRACKRASGKAISRLKEHSDRLFNSAHIQAMKPPYNKQIISIRRTSTPWNCPTARKS